MCCDKGLPLKVYGIRYTVEPSVWYTFKLQEGSLQETFFSPCSPEPELP
jgi:hypothetical protein